MNKIIKIINIIIALYFFSLANLLFWVSILGVLGNIMSKSEKPTNLWTFAFNIVIAPFLIYGSIIFLRKTKAKYLYGAVILGVIWTETQVYRLFFVTQGKLEQTDLSNVLFFGIPFIIILFTRHLNKNNE